MLKKKQMEIEDWLHILNSGRYFDISAINNANHEIIIKSLYIFKRTTLQQKQY